MLKKLFKNLSKKQSNNEIKNNFSLSDINKNVDNILYSGAPTIHSMNEENNLAKKIDDKLVLTKDGNLVMGFEIKGTSYTALSLEAEAQLLNNRTTFFNKISDQIEMNIIIKKDLSNESVTPRKSKNIYANEIIDKWGGTQTFEIKYYIIISTITKTLTGAMESIKNSITSEKKENQNKVEENKQLKAKIIQNTAQQVFSELSDFNPRILESDEIINIYATYTNGEATNFKYSHELLSDCYITSTTEFKKDYIIFTTNKGKEFFGRFISIKAYETDGIKSTITSNLLKNQIEFMVFIHLKPYAREKARKKIKDTAAFAQAIVREELYELLELIDADRENVIEMSYTIFVKADSLEKLEEYSNEITKHLTSQGLAVVRETINQKPLYFSFYPSRGNLNARKKALKTSNVSTITTFEKEVSGFNRNDWGEGAVTQFKHTDGTPFLFNFHSQEKGDRPAGHTMIIGGTGNGKTTITQFLMCNLFKYDIDIFAMDKLRGMYNFTQFVEGEYHDQEEKEFKFNPFTMPNTDENIEFLNHWLGFMANVKDDEVELKKEIANTIDRIYLHRDDNVICLQDFIDSLPTSDSNLKTRFELFKNSIFNHKEDALDFNNQLSIINMDSILQNEKTSALTAFYVFHRLKNQAKNNTTKRGFFCFIDELKDYLNDENMREKILEAILEVRKIGGVMCMGFQNISMFENIPKGASFLDNIANFIIYPTNNEQTIKSINDLVGLTPSQMKFLRETNPNSRKALLIMKLRGETAILDLNLAKLGKYLNVFSSSSDKVALLKRLRSEYPIGHEWREKYLMAN